MIYITSNSTFDQFVQEAVLGKIASDIYNEAKKITALRHVGVRKSKVLSYPPEAAEQVIKAEKTAEKTVEEPKPKEASAEDEEKEKLEK